MADCGIFHSKLSEIVNSLFYTPYIKILGKSIKPMCKNMCDIFKTSIYLKFCIIFFVNNEYKNCKDFIINH